MKLTTVSFFAAAFGLLAMGGCGGKVAYQEVKPPAAPTASGLYSRDLAMRASAALAIESPEERDAALAVVAHDAARMSQPDLVKKCLEKISDKGVQNRAAASAALALAADNHNMGDNGEFSRAAVEVAAKIDDPALREQTLKRIALNQY